METFMIIEKPFKIFKVKKEKDGKTYHAYIARAGADGTGQTLPYLCGFCKDKDGKPMVAFRSAKERRRHANTCPR